MERRRFLRQVALWAGTAAGTAVASCAPQGAGGAEPAGGLPASPVSLRFPYDPTPTNTAYFDRIKAQLNDKYSGKIQIAQDAWAEWGEMYTKWTTQAVAGDAPDVIVLCCQYVRPYFSQGQAAELDPYIRRDWKKGEANDFYRGMWEGMQLDKKQYAIPVYANTPSIFVNRAHLKDAGMAPPPDDWNAARFLEYATRLNRPDREQWGFQLSNWMSTNRHVPFVWAWGGEVHDPKDTGNPITRLTYDHPKTIEALQFLHDLIWKLRLAPATNTDRGGLGAQPAFEQGKVALYLDGAHVLGAFKRRQEADSSFDWDIAYPVKGPAGYGGRIGNDGYMIWRGSRYQEQAWSIIKEINTPELQQARAEITASRPAVKSAQVHFEKQFPGKNMQPMRLLGETARPDPQAYWKDSSQVSNILVKHLQASFERNEISIAEACRLAMAEVRAHYGI